MKKITLLAVIFLFFGNNCLRGQGFEVADTVCVGEVLDIQYAGNGSSFCLVPDANFVSTNISVEYMEPFAEESIPLFSFIVEDDDGFHVFTSLSTNGQLSRLDFGNSLSNTPTGTTLFLDSIPAGEEGIQILNDNGHWWGFIIGGNIDFYGPEYLVRLDFGTSLANTPTVEKLGNIGNLYFPHDLFITKEGNEWVGITINKLGSSITRFSFGNSLANIPTGENLGNIGNLFRPTGFSPIRVGDNWYLFVANEHSHSISRIDFGNSLLNTPTGTNLGNLGMINRPRDITIAKICDGYVGIVLNRTGPEIIVLDFSENIESTPTASSLGNFGDFVFPHSINKYHITEEGIVTFIIDAGNSTVSRLTFSFPLGFNLICKNSITDFEVSYPSEGIYTLQLIIDEGLSTQSSFCKDIVVLPSPQLNLGQDTTSCLQSSVLLESNYPNTIWQDQSEGTYFEATQGGIYIGEVTSGNCTSSDTIEVTFENCEKCYNFPNIFTPDGDFVNDEFKPIIECNSEILEYHLQIFNRWGQKVFETDNPLKGWNGKFKDTPSTSDVYVWKVFFTYSKNNKPQEEIMTGDVTLIR